MPAVLRESTSDSRDEVLVPTVLGDSHSDSMLGNVEDDTLATELGTVEPDTSDDGYEALALIERDIRTEKELSSGNVQQEKERIVTPPLSPVRLDDDIELGFGRPKRMKRPNVKYSVSEYDLSLVSVFCPKKLVSPRRVTSKQTKSKR